jgi:hypothetical protein
MGTPAVRIPGEERTFRLSQLLGSCVLAMFPMGENKCAELQRCWQTVSKCVWLSGLLELRAMRPATRYKALAVIFFVSLGAVVFFHFFPVGAVGDLASLPAIGALVAALFQLGRDSIQHDRAIQLEEGKNRFTVGATSHMANVAFDKHVLFCEEYIAEVFKTLDTLFSRGPHKDALKHAFALRNIRRKWAAWLMPEIEAELEKFEAAIHKIGASAYLVEAVPGEPGAIKEMFQEFANVFGAKYGVPQWQGKPVTEDYTVETVIAGLRKVLGTAELSSLRVDLVKRAVE